jgi:heme-degrading monooxygenase HmoA
MMIHMAVLTPNEGQEQALLDSMRALGGPADAHLGLRQHFIGRDPQSGRLVGITVWDRAEDWAEAIAAGREAQAAGGFDMEAILAGGDAIRLDVIDVVDRVGGVELRGG